MQNFETLVNYQSKYQLPTQYAVVNSDMDTEICFYNYYDYVLRSKDIDVDLLLIFFQNGKLVEHRKLVKSSSVAQIKLSDYVQNYEGPVIVSAQVIDQNYKDKLNPKVPLASKSSTGFYIKWINKKTHHIDLMHEWDLIYDKKNKVDVSNIFLNHTSMQDCGFILWGSSTTDNGVFSYEIQNFKTGKMVFKSENQNIEFLKSQFVSLKSILASQDKNDTFQVRVYGRCISDPLSYEKFTSGDFHIHHF